ncbi:restriction endonuclease subunit S [Bacteroides cellulosilyticus]|uniref:restriction endonuclease subunit S n=1 Tax=Bacteroides cellulosilyticus TaxID=246787 RepID=UPI000E512CE5|nr:restriction endonuclease subunit S [Bacteroides cellulosilyticus]RGQ16753.1 restriction endonuclease subunit S [Bacteroides cellulosilyticus]UVP50849.1 restriction endonuclease subunit S [Bacteroides cellulosilyticus]
MANTNNNKSLNVPILRFPEFTDEWKRSSLGEVTTFVKERIGADKLTRNNYVSTENMNPDFGGINQASSVPNNTNVIHYQKGDVLLSNIRPYLRKVWAASSDGGCSADVFVFRAKSISSSFLHYIMANDTFINYVMSGAKGVKMPRGDKEQILKYIFSTPNIEEQNKISHLLHLLDERISTQNKIIGDLKKLKSAIIDYIFNNEVLSFRKRIHLSDVATKITQKNTNNHVSNVLSNSANQGIIPQSEVFDREIANEDNTSNYFVISQNDFVYNPRKSATAPYGPINRYYGQTDGVISPLYLCFRSHNIDVEYLGWYFKSDSWHKFVYQNGDTGVRHDRVSIKDEIFFSMPLFIHNADEQIEIAKRLNKIESFVKQEEQYLFLLESQKLYLLQQMFI